MRYNAAILSIVALVGLAARGAEPSESPVRPVRNVIVLIVDGCSAEQYTLARWCKGADLALDPIRCGSVRTYIADSVVADSAPAASAFATGTRTSDKFISVGPKQGTLPVVPEPAADLQYRPLATVLEGARLLGKATGVVVTSRACHATPAAYLAHSPSRKAEDDLMEQAVYQGVNYVFGGGLDELLPDGKGGIRKDGEDLTAVLKQRGYELLTTGEQLDKLTAARAFGMFALGPMAPEIDRPQARPGEPTLGRMVRKALELLSRNEQGFFLMVEGSQVDWACHANDPSQLVSDLLAYDDAVAAALEFAKKDGNTLVLAFSDHNTGGMSIGNTRTNKTYSQTSLESLVGPIKNMKASAPALWKKACGDKDPEKVDLAEIKIEDIKRVVAEGWALEISDDDARKIIDIAGQGGENRHNGFGEVISAKYTNIGWTTHGHVGGDVPLHSFGPGRPVGTLDGPAIGRLTAAAVGIDLARLNRRLFVEATAAFGPQCVVIDRKDKQNPVVQIECQGRKARLAANKNVLELDGQTHTLEGVVVTIDKTDKAYLPQQAVNLIRGSTDALPAIAP